MTDRAGVDPQLRGRDHPAKADVDATTAYHSERAAAMGRAGSRLDDALGEYRAALDTGQDAEVVRLLLDEVVAQLWRLQLQRECAGARSGNLDSIARAYDVPVEALRRV